MFLDLETELTKKQRYCFRCNFFTSKARRAAFFGFFRGQLCSFHLAQCAHHTSSMLLPASSPLPWLASHLLWVGFSWTLVCTVVMERDGDRSLSDRRRTTVGVLDLTPYSSEWSGAAAVSC